MDRKYSLSIRVRPDMLRDFRAHAHAAQLEGALEVLSRHVTRIVIRSPAEADQVYEAASRWLCTLDRVKGNQGGRWHACARVAALLRFQVTPALVERWPMPAADLGARA
jgi:hypothetical protein